MYLKLNPGKITYPFLNFRRKQLSKTPVIRRSTSLSSTSSAISTNHVRATKMLHKESEYSRNDRHSSPLLNKPTENKTKIAYLKELVGHESNDLNLDALDKSIINEIISSCDGNNSPRQNINIHQENPETKVSYKNNKKGSNARALSVDEEWKWKEPTDDENDSDRDDAGGLTLKVHSSILDESVNISNLNVSFNAALQPRSQSAVERQKARKHEQKVCLL